MKKYLFIAAAILGLSVAAFNFPKCHAQEPLSTVCNQTINDDADVEIILEEFNYNNSFRILLADSFYIDNNGNTNEWNPDPKWMKIWNPDISNPNSILKCVVTNA